MFIPALLVSTCAVALYEKLEAISEEGAIACVAVGLVSIVTTIIVAPWQFHLLMVLTVLLLRFSPSNRFPALGRWFQWNQSFSVGTFITRMFR